MRVYTLEISRHCFKSINSLSVEISKFLKPGICDCGLIPKFLTCCIDFLNCSSAGQHLIVIMAAWLKAKFVNDELSIYIFLSVFYAL